VRMLSAPVTRVLRLLSFCAIAGLTRRSIRNPAKFIPELRCSQITSQAFTFLLAGYETTANALAFATYLLALNPDKEAKMCEEIDAFGRDATPSYDDLVKVRLTRVCLQWLPDGLTACHRSRYTPRRHICLILPHPQRSHGIVQPRCDAFVVLT